jgi:hypothetical protein
VQCLQKNLQSHSYFDLDPYWTGTGPHALAHSDGQLSTLEPLINQPQSHNKFVAFQTPNGPTIYEIPHFFQDVHRQSAAQPNFLSRVVEDVLRDLVVVAGHRWEVETFVCGPNALVAFPLAVGDLVTPALARTLVVLVGVFPALDAHDACTLLLVTLNFVFIFRRRGLLAHGSTHLACVLRW